MEDTKEKVDSMYMNIENFSKAISGNWNIDSNDLRNYIFANISVGLVKNNEMKKDINKIYYGDKLKYYNAAINSSCINHIIMTQGTLEQEIYARKVLGILLVAEEDYNLRSTLVKILRKYYPVVFNSVKKRSKKELKEKYEQMDGITREIEARLDAAVYFYFAIYRSAELVDQGFIISILNDMKNFEFSNPMTANIEEELQKHKAEIQDIKALVKREYGKISNYKDVLNSDNEYMAELAIILENLFIINKLDINYIFKNSEFLNMDKIILAYVKAEKSEIDIKELVQILICGIFIQSFVNEYKNSRKLYFENNQETLYFQLNTLEEKFRIFEEENKEIKLINSNLEKEKKSFDENLNIQINKLNKKHRSEVNELQNKIKDLENQLLEEKKYRSELNTLREYIFEVNNDYTPRYTGKTLGEYINDKKIIIIGGAKEWRRRFRDKFPEIRTLNGFNENFDINILNNVDYIFFYTGFMNHSTYYKVMNFIRVYQIKFGYIGKTNIELVEEEIIGEIQRCNKK